MDRGNGGSSVTGTTVITKFVQRKGTRETMMEKPRMKVNRLTVNKEQRLKVNNVRLTKNNVLCMKFCNVSVQPATECHLCMVKVTYNK